MTSFLLEADHKDINSTDSAALDDPDHIDASVADAKPIPTSVIIGGATEVKPTFEKPPVQLAATDDAQLTCTLTPLSKITQTPVAWLWKNHIQVGELALLTGEEGVGKSTIAYDLAARVTTGAAMPDGSPGTGPADVIIISLEDAADSTIKPRIIAAGGNPNRVHLFEVSEAGLPVAPALDQHHELLEKKIAQVGAKLLILDPLLQTLGKVNRNDERQVRNVLGPLIAVLRRQNAAAIGIRHLTKDKKKGLGSVAFRATARSELVVGRDPEASHIGVLAVGKVNGAAVGPAIRFEIEKTEIPGEHGPVETSKITWLEATDLTAIQIVAPPSKPINDGKLALAKKLILESLHNGPIPTKDLEKAASANCVSRKSLERARTDLGVVAEKIGKQWLVSLPAPPTAQQKKIAIGSNSACAADGGVVDAHVVNDEGGGNQHSQ